MMFGRRDKKFRGRETAGQGGEFPNRKPRLAGILPFFGLVSPGEKSFAAAKLRAIERSFRIGNSGQPESFPFSAWSLLERKVSRPRNCGPLSEVSESETQASRNPSLFRLGLSWRGKFRGRETAGRGATFPIRKLALTVSRSLSLTGYSEVKKSAASLHRRWQPAMNSLQAISCIDTILLSLAQALMDCYQQISVSKYYRRLLT
jgi:hypothetical protein